MVALVDKVVHVGPNQGLVEAQLGDHFLLCVIDGEAVLLCEYLGRLGLLIRRHLVPRHYQADPDKVVRLRLRKLIEVAIEKRWTLIVRLDPELTILFAH